MGSLKDLSEDWKFENLYLQGITERIRGKCTFYVISVPDSKI